MLVWRRRKIGKKEGRGTEEPKQRTLAVARGKKRPNRDTVTTGSTLDQQSTLDQSHVKLGVWKQGTALLFVGEWRGENGGPDPRSNVKLVPCLPDFDWSFDSGRADFYEQ